MADSDINPHPKRFLLLGMMLFKDILPILAQEHKNGAAHRGFRRSVLTAVFTPDFILTALHLLIDKLLPLTANDLAKVEEDPEEWLVTQGVDEEAWPFEFRVGDNSALWLIAAVRRTGFDLPDQRLQAPPA